MVNALCLYPGPAGRCYSLVFETKVIILWSCAGLGHFGPCGCAGGHSHKWRCYVMTLHLKSSVLSTSGWQLSHWYLRKLKIRRVPMLYTQYNWSFLSSMCHGLPWRKLSESVWCLIVGILHGSDTFIFETGRPGYILSLVTPKALRSLRTCDWRRHCESGWDFRCPPTPPVCFFFNLKWSESLSWSYC